MVDDEENPPSEDPIISTNNKIINNDIINSPTAFDEAVGNDIKDGATDTDKNRDTKSHTPTPESLSPESGDPTTKNRSINSYYGHKVGALHTISLILSVGLILYAHIGLSAVFLSSRDPTITSSTNACASTTAAAAGTVNNTDKNNTSTNSTTTGEGVPTGADEEEGGLCDTQQDMMIWADIGGMPGQGNQSVFCSTVWNGGCFLNTTCVEQCFQEEYGYTSNCSTCFGQVPVCGVANNCIMVW